ncbi:MAG: tetratricopeptide repeat protein [Nitrospirae bacterium]|nr:tetratricopeptide repeat protein [Nitrospirota bacterium]
MSSNWTCNGCNAVNPDSRTKCQGCGIDRPKGNNKRTLLIVGIAVAALVLIGLLVYMTSKMANGPKLKYKEALKKCCETIDCCAGGDTSCTEGDKIAKSYKISDSNRQKLIDEVRKEKCKPSPPPTPPSGPPTPLPPANDSRDEMKKQEAIKHLEEGFHWIALVNVNKGNKAAFVQYVDNAINEYTKAIEINSNDNQTTGKAYEQRGTAYMLLKKRNKALDDLKTAARLLPNSYSVFYNLTCLYSLDENTTDLALESLDKALENGFTDYNLLRKDTELKNLRKSSEFKRILEKHKVFITIDVQ